MNWLELGWEEFRQILKDKGFSERYVAKKDGTNIVEHTWHVWLSYVDYRRNLPDITKFDNLCQHYYQRSADEIAFLCIVEHDRGKMEPHWQYAAKNFYFQDKTPPKEKTWPRHELITLGRLLHPEDKSILDHVRCLVGVAIASHHNRLSRRHKHRFEEVLGFEWDDGKNIHTYWGNFSSYGHPDVLYNHLDSLRKPIDKESAEHKDVTILLSYFRWVLTLSDRNASMIEAFKPPFELAKKFNFEFIYDEMTPIQKKILASKSKRLLVKAPTGQGKTHACFLKGKQLADEGVINRVVMLEPLTFIVDSVKQDTEKAFIETTVRYHNAKYMHNQGYNEAQTAYWLEKEHVICTADHAIHALTARTEGHHGALYNLMMNSLVVIDEIDFYDNILLGNIIELLRWFDHFGTPYILMSATMPDSFQKLLEDELEMGAPDMIEDRSNDEKVRVDVVGIYKDPDFRLSDFIHIIEDNATIIFVNTISRAQAFKTELVACGYPENQIDLHHSQYTLKDRAAKETKLMKTLGTEGWFRKNDDGTVTNLYPKRVLITTQVSEAGLDISSEFIISDYCPIDKIIQRIGRGGRFKGQPHPKLVLVEPYTADGVVNTFPYDDSNAKMPNGDELDWDKDETLTPLMRTKKYMRTGLWTIGELSDLNNKVYDELELKERTRHNMARINYINHWNMIYKPTVGEENMHGEWLPRDIVDDKIHVSVVPFADSYERWSDFHHRRMQNTVAIKIRDFNKLLDDNLILQKSVFIERIGEKESIHYFTNPEDHYCSKMGYKTYRMTGRDTVFNPTNNTYYEKKQNVNHTN